MKNIETGGPAFPCDPTTYTEAKGMTLRDYFAAKVAQAMSEEVSRYDQFQAVAKNAYKMADAMMEARK